MAWVDGGNLRQRIKALARPLTLAEVGSILQPICSALNFAHNMHAYHCDIKPSNIMLHQNGRDVFLADFGVARLADEKKGGGGTHQYFAPERFSHVVDAKTDIYALGVTVYEMLSGGNLPYHGDSRSPGSTTRDRLAWEHSHLPLPPLREFNDSLPQEILDIVDKALRKEPSQRFDSALSFWKAFERATGSSRVVAPVEDATRFEPQPSGNKNVGEAHSEPIKPSQPPFTPSALGRTYLEGQSGELAGQFIPISSPSMQVGRGTACQIRLLEQSVSRHHATLIVTRRGVYLRDDGSSLGTLLNGVRIPPHVPMPLHSGDVIQIGYFQIFAFRSG
jgi:serine/threonine protein kinase